jgi:uncharacterized protein DUF4177
MNEWEYKIVTIDTRHEPDTLEWISGFEEGSPEVQKLLDSMSREGWELVAFFPARPVDQVVENTVTGQRLELDANPWLHNAIFKKPPETMEERTKRVQGERLMRHMEEHRQDRK